MALEAIYNQSIIVGALTLVICLTIIWVEVEIVLVAVKDKTSDSRGRVFPMSALVGAISLLIIASALMIFIIFKKRHHFMVPWLILMSLGSVIFIIGVFNSFVRAASYRCNGFLLSFIFTGFDIMISYPIYDLYLQMRQGNAGKLQIIDISD